MAKMSNENVFQKIQNYLEKKEKFSRGLSKRYKVFQ
jgi:hypothetical protein